MHNMRFVSCVDRNLQVLDLAYFQANPTVADRPLDILCGISKFRHLVTDVANNWKPFLR